MTQLAAGKKLGLSGPATCFNPAMGKRDFMQLRWEVAVPCNSPPPSDLCQLAQGLLLVIDMGRSHIDCGAWTWQQQVQHSTNPNADMQGGASRDGECHTLG